MKIVIVGAGGFGREVLSLIRNINQVKPTFEVLGFIDDGLPEGLPVHEYSVLGGMDGIEKTSAEGVVIAVGDPKTREKLANQLPATFKKPNLIHPLAVFHDLERITIGKGCIIGAGNIFTTDIALGNFCIVNLSCTLGHDSAIEDFSSIMPGVNISGGAHLKRGAYIGTGAKLIKATTLGQYCKVGAGAVVDSDVADETTVVGIPAKPLKK